MAMSTRGIVEHGFGSVEEYQEFHGLKSDGVVGPVTKRSLEEPRFCGLPDHLEARNNGSLCKWSKRQLVYGFLKPETWGLGIEDIRRAFRIAWDRWEAVCDIKASHVSNSQEAADVIIASGRIDGPSGTLAWSELPCGSDSPKDQKYDNQEPWVLSDDPPRHKIDLIRVACHEIGHVIGIGHISPGNLLAPTYSASVNKPQAGDISEAVKRYGAPTSPPTGGGGGSESAWVTVQFREDAIKLP